MSRPAPAWVRVPGGRMAPFVTLASAFHPAVRQKPFDLWRCLRAYCRAAVPPPGRPRGAGAGGAWDEPPEFVRVAVHYVWDAPALAELERRFGGGRRPSGAARRILRRFRRHEARWGPGDVEGVWMTLRRRRRPSGRPGGRGVRRLDAGAYRVVEIDYRTGANVAGVLRQIARWEWDKIGRARVRYRLPHPGIEMDGPRPVLTVDSYHHSFHRAGAAGAGPRPGWSVVVPALAYFDARAWRHFQVEEKRRGFEPWEAS